MAIMRRKGRRNREVCPIDSFTPRDVLDLPTQGHFMEPILIASAIICLFAGSAAVGGLRAESKRRKPLEGMLLGLLLGPIGVVIEVMLPDWTRPVVDEGSQSSFRSMVTYQDSPIKRGRSR